MLVAGYVKAVRKLLIPYRSARHLSCAWLVGYPSSFLSRHWKSSCARFKEPSAHSPECVGVSECMRVCVCVCVWRRDLVGVRLGYVYVCEFVCVCVCVRCCSACRLPICAWRASVVLSCISNVDTLGFVPRLPRMLNGFDTIAPCALRNRDLQ